MAASATAWSPTWPEPIRETSPVTSARPESGSTSWYFKVDEPGFSTSTRPRVVTGPR